MLLNSPAPGNKIKLETLGVARRELARCSKGGRTGQERKVQGSLSEERRELVFQRIRLSAVQSSEASRRVQLRPMWEAKEEVVVVRSGEFSINSQPFVSESCICQLNSVQRKDYFKSLCL